MPGIRKPSKYNKFMSEHLPGEIKKCGSQTVAFKKCVKMWNESKKSRSRSRSPRKSASRRSPGRRSPGRR